MSTNQPNPLAEGIWPCTVLSGSAGESEDKPGVVVVRVNVKIDDGPSKGRMVTYEDELNAKSSLYIMRSMRAAGWKGKTVAAFESDVDEWVKSTGGKSTVEVRHIEVKKGKKFDKWVDGGRQGPAPIWDKVNSIGRGAKPLAAPKGEALSDADDLLRRAMQEEGSWNGGAPEDDAPHAATRDPDDIPFITCSASASLGEIAKVLR